VAERLVNRLKVERARLDLTQAELAERAGVTRKTINTIENGVFVPSTLLALRIAKVLGRPVEALFGIETDEDAG
jgi:putative transcriptional regulator